MYSTVFLEGHIISEPELKYSRSGKAYTRIMIRIPVSSYGFSDKPICDNIPIALFGQVAFDLCGQFKRGDAIQVQCSVHRGHNDNHGLDIIGEAFKRIAA